MYIHSIKLNKELPKGSYLSDLPVIRNLKAKGELTFDKPITFLVGENGIGKSTLIEAIAVSFGFNPEGGSKNYSFYTKNTHSPLADCITVVKSYQFAKNGFFLRAESFYNTISYMDYLDTDAQSRTNDRTYFDQLIEGTAYESSQHNMSHGESFLNAVRGFRGNGLYIFDEPEAALSPTGIMKLMAHIHALVKENCQFIISTHSPMLISLPNSDVYQLTKKGIDKVPFSQTEHYTTTRRFLENPDKMMKYLLSDDE